MKQFHKMNFRLKKEIELEMLVLRRTPFTGNVCKNKQKDCFSLTSIQNNQISLPNETIS